jgi:hypothetical protein
VVVSERKASAVPHEADEQGILDMLVPRGQARIEGQLRDSDALDAKALGILGVTAAAIALMVAVRHDLNRFWWIPTAALGVAAVLLLAAVWPRTFDVGPDVRRFYEVMGGAPRLTASRQMLLELLAAIDQNDRELPHKRRLFKAGLVLVLALLGALTVALVGEG